MKEIQLTQGYCTIVDDDVFEWASKFKWFQHSGGYAARKRRVSDGPGNRLILLHREILGLKDTDADEVDHIDQNRGNNLKKNLRRCNHRQNTRNAPSKGGQSPFKGVSLSYGKWRIWILTNKGRRTAGNFPTEEDAARAYDKMAVKEFAEFAHLNFPENLSKYKEEIRLDTEKEERHIAAIVDLISKLVEMQNIS